MGKLDTRAVSARPRGPSALPSNHEIVSEGCELSGHAYKFLGPRPRSGPTPSKNSAYLCLNDETCVVVSRGVHNSKEYCIGCKVPLWLKFDGAKPYKKVKTDL